MKKIMEMLQNMKAKNEKKDNKGFSLVELIIVIAIMAILVGIVGTQVIPYINKSKEAKDLQIVNSYSTAAVSAYSMLASELTTTTGTLKVEVYKANGGGAAADCDQDKLAKKIKELTGYNAVTDLYNATAKSGKMTSTEGQKVSGITIDIDLDAHSVETSADGTKLGTVKAEL